MSAADASGALALMQDFLQNHLGHTDASGRFTNSPALMKAMLINGARSAGILYDLATTNTINYQAGASSMSPTACTAGWLRQPPRPFDVPLRSIAE